MSFKRKDLRKRREQAQTVAERAERWAREREDLSKWSDETRLSKDVEGRGKCWN
jgi:hypothetical protein